MGNLVMGFDIYKALPIIIYLLTKWLELKKGKNVCGPVSCRYMSEYEIMDVLRTMPELQGKSELELYQIAKRVKQIARF